MRQLRRGRLGCEKARRRVDETNPNETRRDETIRERRQNRMSRGENGSKWEKARIEEYNEERDIKEHQE